METDPEKAFVKGVEHGMHTAVSMARDGNLRLQPLPFEKDVYPYHNKLRAWKMTKLVWLAWWRENIHDERF